MRHYLTLATSALDFRTGATVEDHEGLFADYGVRKGAPGRSKYPAH